MPLNWDNVINRYRANPISRTKTGKVFRVSRVTNTAICIALPSREQYISRKNLEAAVRLIEEGTKIPGPAEYRRLVSDERPAFAWAILRDKGFVEQQKVERFNITAAIWEEESVYVSKCPELGVASCGDTAEEALDNLKEAVELYIDNAIELGIIEDVNAALKSCPKFTSTFEVTV